MIIVAVDGWVDDYEQMKRVLLTQKIKDRIYDLGKKKQTSLAGMNSKNVWKKIHH